MTEDPAASIGQPKVLLAVNTGHRYALQYFDLLRTMGCDAEISSYKNDEIEYMKGPYDLIIHMGLGKERTRVAGLEKVRRTSRKLFPGVPLLVLSGHDPSYALGEVRAKGAADFLQCKVVGKPRELCPEEKEVFVEKVRKLLGPKLPPSQ
jgi:hypothetical protein